MRTENEVLGLRNCRPGRLLVEFWNPQSSILHLRSSILSPQSPILHPQSSVLSPQSLVLNSQSSTLCPQLSVLNSLDNPKSKI